MSKPRYPWWGYVKAIIRRYDPSGKWDGIEKKENDSVLDAVAETRDMPDGEERMKLVQLIFWEKTHTLEGAALEINCSERTARRWHTDFIKCVARHYGLLEN